jgi:hypothetical protein
VAIQVFGAERIIMPNTNIPSMKSVKSISMWIYSNVWDTTARSFFNATNNTTSNGWQIGHYGTGKIRVWKYNGSPLVEATAPATGAWFHLAYTFNGNNSHILYLNNVATTTATSVTDSSILVTSVCGNEWNEHLDGYMEDMRIYNRVLTPNEIQTIYALCGNDGIHYGLVARWQCMEGYEGQAVTTLMDSSPNAAANNSTSIIGSPLYSTNITRGSRKLFGNSK